MADSTSTTTPVTAPKIGFFKAIWNFLDGKKTTISAVYWTLAEPTILAMYPNGAPHNLSVIMTIIGAALTVFGLGHKIVKASTGGDAE